MFTGIITDLGSVRAISGSGDKRFEFSTAYDTSTVDMGASIACSGVCLTVIDKGPNWFAAMVSNETLSCTTLRTWQEGTPVNLERALKVGDELGGHIVSGHVDGVGEVTSLSTDADSHRFSFSVPTDLSRQIAAKGSITIDGISLTVNEVGENTFGVNIIPHTMAVTSIGKKQIGDAVNLEVDMLARYVARLLNKD
ncbi:MAG: riboflavin synthase [Rhodospirillales bacterium]|nr:riboflavin synthase [Rhodospirillales bacterium]MBT5350154.1 riboflavin synthase [Rhodospirillales bacterium]MBT5522356.1 riboflavin synthase [Rhodospirillales bacterium]MBT6108458.1 riboflavin synthase [Rhodospirillales bacterium]MBT6825842.1 riboflavin synthase [Rhodospirillales bacterium]